MNAMARIMRRYPIVSIEDPFHEDDWDGFKGLTGVIGCAVQVVGDDLFVTNPERLREELLKSQVMQS